MMRADRELIFKYHGLGNDFVILDRRQDGQDIDSATAQQLCDRRRGIGADGVLVLLPSESAAARMTVHNADGSIAEMCGNGIRCAAKYLVDRSDRRPASLVLETEAGPLSCELIYRNGTVDEVQVAMGPAQLQAENLPSRSSGRSFVNQPLPGFPGLRGTAISMGNPHLVLFGTPPEDAGRLGPELERIPAFPERTNVGFAQLREGSIRLRVWERGAGLTEACGTGACAAVAAAVAEKRLPGGQWVPVELPGGVLQVRCEPDFSRVDMRGPASFVFEASVALSPESGDRLAPGLADSSAERTPGKS
jgi:diaminopimelate epimerase